VLYALRDPLSFVVLLVSFLVAVTLHGWVQAVVAARVGLRAPAAEGRTAPDPRRHLDPFGAIAAAISGIGWAKPVAAPDRRRRGPLLAVLLSGPAVNVLLGLAVLAVVPVVAAATGSLFGFVDPTRLLQTGIGGDLLPRVLLLFGLSNLMVGLLSLVPIPPLDGGRLLFALGPRSVGWQKAEYHLDERNIGVAVLLVLLLIPLGGPQALLPAVLDTVAGPLVRLITGG
jgi:Zn-dependent protease